MKSKILFAVILSMALLPFPIKADIEPSLGELLPIYLVEDIEGLRNVQVLKEGESDWKNAKEGQRLEEGDRIRVGDGTEVVLSLKSDTLVHLDEGAEIVISQLADNESKGFLSHLKLLVGSILSDVKKNLPETHSQFEVEAGGIVCGVRGTVFEVSKKGEDVETTTHEGVVYVKTPHGTQPCKAGQTCASSKGHAPTVHPCNKNMNARFQAWRGMRQQMMQNRQKGPGPGMGHRGTGQMLGRSPSFGGKGAGGLGVNFKPLKKKPLGNEPPSTAPGAGPHAPMGGGHH